MRLGRRRLNLTRTVLSDPLHSLIRKRRGPQKTTFWGSRPALVGRAALKDSAASVPGCRRDGTDRGTPGGLTQQSRVSLWSKLSSVVVIALRTRRARTEIGRSEQRVQVEVGGVEELEAHRMFSRVERRRLAAYKVPRSFAFLDELPKSSALKILRRELQHHE